MNATIDASKVSASYAAAFQRFKQLPGFSQRDTLRAEAGSILKSWAGRVKVVTEPGILRGARLRAGRNLGLTQFASQSPAVTINVGMRRRGNVGNIWLRGAQGKPVHMGVVSIESGSVAFNRKSNGSRTWQAIISSVNAYRSEYPKTLNEVRGAQGISRQSVIQIAEALKIDLSQVQGGGLGAQGYAKAKAAIAASGKSYQNGLGYEAGDTTKYYIQLINRLPYNTKIGMDRDLAWAISGRAGFIERSYAKGTFDSLAKVAAAFPNIKVAA